MSLRMDSAWRVALCRRSTDMTDEERQFLDRVRREGAKFWPGQTLRLYFPRSDPAQAEERSRRILEALRRGEPAAQIAQRERVTTRLVRKLRGRIGGTLPP